MILYRVEIKNDHGDWILRSAHTDQKKADFMKEIVIRSGQEARVTLAEGGEKNGPPM